MSYFFNNAPSAMLIASLPGAVNYVIILLIVHSSGYSDGGVFRLLVSVFGLFGLVSLLESRKAFIGAYVAKDSQALLAIVMQRVLVAIALFSIILGIFLFERLIGSAVIPASALWIAGLSTVIYSFDYHLPLLQARRQFSLLLVLELAKYGLGMLAFLFVFHAEGDIPLATAALFCAIAGLHGIYFWWLVRPQISSSTNSPHWRLCFTLPAAKRARTLSYANLFPASLEHVDKLLVWWIFGTEFLGIYVLAYSTGRILYNALKPALYIYYRQFVDRIPGRDLLFNVGIGFTLLGAIFAATFIIALDNFSVLEKFQKGHEVTIILFLCYGIGMVRAVFGQAYALNKKANAEYLLRASIIASCGSMLFLLGALLALPNTALILLALQYPARDTLTILLLARYRKVGA